MGLLRFLLAISVVAAHAGPVLGSDLVGGETAVETFFIVSGFYMGLILDGKYAGPSSYGLFVTNRLLRIFPLFLVCLALSVAVELAVYAMRETPLPTRFGLGNTVFVLAEQALRRDPLQACLLIFTNLALFFRSVLVVLAADPATGDWVLADGAETPVGSLIMTQFVPQAWTLDVELVFYLIVPFLARRSMPVLGAALLGALLLRLGIQAWVEARAPSLLGVVSYYFLPTQLALFVAGLCVYRVYRRFGSSLAAAAGWPMIAAVALATVFYFDLPVPDAYRSKAYYLLVLVCLPFMFAATRFSAADRFVGETAYPIYVGHVIVITLYAAFGGPVDASGTWCALGAVVLAILLTLTVTARIERIRQRRVAANVTVSAPRRDRLD